MNILMVAAENGAIPGGKVGGMGDVLRDIPQALAQLGHTVDVLVPGYQAFSKLPGSEQVATLETGFRGQRWQAELFQLPLENSSNNVRCWVIDHPLLAPFGEGRVYCNDQLHQPFETDAAKFAFFSAAVCQFLLDAKPHDYDVVHLHDWHTAFVAILATYSNEFRSLQKNKFVFTIHNLALQGIRPFGRDHSSLDAWFPDLDYQREPLADPRYPDCVNPMRAAINICSKVHSVSPSYVEEILRPSAPVNGFFGGEGLESDLQKAHADNRLVGILNGCEYPEKSGARAAYSNLLSDTQSLALQEIGKHTSVPSCHYLLQQQISQRKRARKPSLLLTSIGRLTNQKVLLFQVVMVDGKSCLEHILLQLDENELFILLGSGDSELEQFFTGIAGRYANFMFIRGYSESVSEQLYKLGSLFLMPSSFEPCGISQMLAMRAGQPCVVHGVGGLADTVVDGEDGFVFRGENPEMQAQAFMEKTLQALSLCRANDQQWKSIKAAAAAKRFLWSDSARNYCEQLYT